MGATAGCAGATYTRRIDIRQRLEEVNRAYAVPKLKSAQADSPELIAEIGPRRFLGGPIIQEGILRDLLRQRVMRHLCTVEETNHIVRKGHVTLPGEADAPGGDGAGIVILQPSVGPMTVRVKDCGMAIGSIEGPV